MNVSTEWYSRKRVEKNCIHGTRIFGMIVYLQNVWPKIYNSSFIFGSAIINFMVSLTPLPHMPILGSSDSAENEDTMSKIWINRDTMIWLSRKHCGKRRNCSLWAISSFSTMFSKAVCSWCVKMSIYGVKGYKNEILTTPPTPLKHLPRL